MGVHRYKKALEVAVSMRDQNFSFASSCLYEALIELQTQVKDPEEVTTISNRISELINEKS
jgi:hypothetical protein